MTRLKPAYEVKLSTFDPRDRALAQRIIECGYPILIDLNIPEDWANSWHDFMVPVWGQYRSRSIGAMSVAVTRIDPADCGGYWIGVWGKQVLLKWDAVNDSAVVFCAYYIGDPLPKTGNNLPKLQEVLDKVDKLFTFEDFKKMLRPYTGEKNDDPDTPTIIGG